MKKILAGFFISILGGIVALGTYIMFFDKSETIYTVQEKPAVQFANLPGSSQQQVDLTRAAEFSVKTVVHVKTLYDRNGQQNSNPLYDFFFGNSGRGYHHQQPVIGSGSGVILSGDGYIVTNNHVVKGSGRINVVLSDKRSYEAKLVGQDPVTDLALLQIEEKNLPHILMGDSDAVRLGEWVLAVGNPFNLTSTVTAGIISAKARTLGLSSNRMSIEAFLQTDAAVNPGNSGGALVNAKGELVGINTAIESRTGSYSGYSFAIPVNIVKKIVNDLKQYGEVQRAFIGVSINTVDALLAKKVGLEKIEGVYIANVNEDGAADRAGIKSGDVILDVNGKYVNSSSELQEQVSMFKPGDKVLVLIKRDGKKKQIELILRNKLGETGVIKTKGINILGANFAPITREEKYKLQINRGVRVESLHSGKLKNEGIEEGFIIFKINNTPIHNVEDIKEALQQIRNGGVFISGIYPNGKVAYYAFSLNKE